MSASDPSLAKPMTPHFNGSTSAKDSPQITLAKETLHLQAHPEGGFFVETDRDPIVIPNPYATPGKAPESGNETRNASTSIYYFLTPGSPQGNFHRNKGRTIHTLHRGRGRYVLIHADEVDAGGKARIETFVVGHDLGKGERLQWMVEGGKYKASYLMPDTEDGHTSDGLLISETVVPGFDYRDHDFLERSKLGSYVTPEQEAELSWLIRQDHGS